MKKFMQTAMLVLGMFSCGYVQALSADAPPVDWTLNPISTYEVQSGEAGRGYTQLTVATRDEGGHELEEFQFFCKRGNPKLFIVHNAIDVTGEYSEWADGFAIQYYAPGETKARDLFMSDEDFLIVGRQGINLRMALAKLGRYTEGHFTFTLFSTGMHGEITTNVISNAMTLDVAKAMSKKFMEKDPMVCDAGTGDTATVDITLAK